jgi:thiamine kinase-like enzyme
MASMCDPRLAQEFARYKDRLGFRGCHIRELEVMKHNDPAVARHLPIVYGTYANAEREAYVIVEELLEDMAVMDDVDTLDGWSPAHIEAAIRAVAEVHAQWYGHEAELREQPWVMDTPDPASREEMQRLWEMLGVHAREEFPEMFTDNDLTRFRTIISHLPQWWQALDTLPKTLIHNDFSPRNIAFRDGPNGPEPCIYDWELATVHAPQYDLAELLVFTCQPDTSTAEIEHYIELHRQTLETLTGQAIDRAQWRRGFSLCLLDLMVCRLSLYTMAHTFRHYGFVERVRATLREMIAREGALTFPWLQTEATA